MTLPADRAYHRPISMVIEGVRKMPDVRELPIETQLTFNLKGNRKTALLLIREIISQVLDTDFFAVEITGPS